MPLLERELAVGIRGVVVHVVLAGAQQAALLQKALDASHHALEHAPDLTRRQVRQRVKHDVCAFFLVDPIEKEHVKVWIESQIGRSSLQRHDGATLATGDARLLHALCVKCKDRLHEEARQRAEERRVEAQARAPRKRER